MTSHRPAGRRLIGAVLLAALAATGCASSSADDSAGDGSGDAKDLSSVTLKVGDQKAGSQVLLQAAGELSAIPYRITWAQFTSGPPLLEAANAGAVDIGAVGNTPPIFAAAAHSKITIVAAHAQAVGGQALLVPKDSTVRTAAELRGRDVAVAKGSSAHHHLLVVLKRAGLSFSDVKVHYLAPPDALAAFTSGRVDAWDIWDPYTAQAELRTGARALVRGTGGTVAPAGTPGAETTLGFQVASDSALHNAGKRAAILDYLTRIARARSWVTTHQKQWAQVWAQQTGLPVAATLLAVQRSASLPVPIDDGVVAAEQSVADTLREAKLIPGRVRVTDFVDRSFNDRVTAATASPSTTTPGS